MTSTILIYNDQESQTCTYELSVALEKEFGHLPVAIVETDRRHLTRNIHELDPQIIILPEIKGERSHYHEHIPQDTRQALRNHIGKGRLMVTFCAAAYWMAEDITYTTSCGRTLTQGGDDVFNAVALKSKGPMKGYGRKSNGQEDLGGCIRVPVMVKTPEGWREDFVWYGNGPGFFEIEGQSLPKGFNALVRYKDIEEQPIAVCSTPFGRGEIVMSGVLSHYHYTSTPMDPGRVTNLAWTQMTGRMHQQLFAKPRPTMLSVPA